MREIDFNDFWSPSFTYFNPQVNALQALTNTMGVKRWELEERGFPEGISYIPNGNITYSCSLERLLLATGVSLTNASTGNAIEAWYAVLRHINLFTSDDYLRADSHYKETDPHVKTSTSDEIGMGACVCVLGDNYDVKFLANAGYFIKETVNDSSSRYYKKSLKKLGINGDSEPDFFCLTTKNEAVIAEAKGTFGSLSNLNEPLKKGIKQVSNILPVGIPLRENASRIVVATQIPINDYNRKSTLPHSIIMDPEESEILRVSITSDQLIRYCISQTMGFTGYRSVAADFFANKPINYWITSIEKYELTINERVFNPVLYLGNGWFLAYVKELIQAIKNNEEQNISIVNSLRESTFYNVDLSSNDTERVKLLPMGFGLINVDRKDIPLNLRRKLHPYHGSWRREFYKY